jgi:hypothetical protein
MLINTNVKFLIHEISRLDGLQYRDPGLHNVIFACPKQTFERRKTMFELDQAEELYTMLDHADRVDNMFEGYVVSCEEREDHTWQ